MVCSDDGTVEETVSHLPYGDEESHTGNVLDPEPYSFTGKEFERDLGLYYFGARRLNPALGRWMSVDPEAIKGGTRAYVYGAESPFKFVDPDGRDPVPTKGEWQNSQKVVLPLFR